MKFQARLSLVLLLVLVAFPTLAQETSQKSPRPIAIDDLFQIRDVSQPELSPDGQWVAYTVRTKMLKEDKNEQRLWMISTRGGDAIPLTAKVSPLPMFAGVPTANFSHSCPPATAARRRCGCSTAAAAKPFA